MQRKWHLPIKILVLTCIPLCFQLILFATLTVPESRSHSTLAELERHVAVNADGVAASASLIDIWLKAYSGHGMYITTPEFDEQDRAAMDKLRHMKTLLENDPESLEAASRALEDSQKLSDLVAATKDRFLEGGFGSVLPDDLYEQVGRKARSLMARATTSMHTLLNHGVSQSNSLVDDLSLNDQVCMTILQWIMALECVALGLGIFWTRAERSQMSLSVGALLPFASLLLLQFGSATALLVLDQQSQNNSKTIRQSMHARDLLSTAIFGNLSLQHALFMLPLNAPEINQNLTETIAAFDALSNELKEPKNLAAASAHADKNLRICRDQARQGQEMMRAGTYRNNGERRVWPPISRAMHEMAADTGTLNAFFVEEEAQTVKAIGNEGWARRLSLIILLVTTVLEMILTAVTVILLSRGLPPSGRP